MSAGGDRRRRHFTSAGRESVAGEGNDMSPQEQIVARFAPTGTLRAAINLGNPILAGSDPSSGAPRGVSVDLARALGERLGVDVAFTAPYVLIEGCYLVRDDSPLRSNDEVDRAGHVVVVGQGSAYDLHLSRALKQASIVRAPTSPAVVETFIAQRADVAAGVKQQLEADIARIGGLRLLGERFMVIRQAMGLAKTR